MLTRILYRVAAIHFFGMACACWLAAAGFVLLQVGGLDIEALMTAVVFLVAGLIAANCSGDAWRMGRYDPLYD
jgi:hypothetical protein